MTCRSLVPPGFPLRAQLGSVAQRDGLDGGTVSVYVQGAYVPRRTRLRGD